MTTKDILDKDGVRLPIKIDSTSNGEYEPIPISKRNREEQIAGSRVEVAPFKQDPADFVLWTQFARETDLIFIDFVFSAFRNHGENLTYRLGVYAKEAKPFIAFNTFSLLKIFFGKQYEGKEIVKNNEGKYIIVSKKLNPSYLRPFRIIKNLVIQTIKFFFYKD